MIKYDDIIELLRKQFTIIMNNNEDFYGDYKIYISNEQQYVKIAKLEKNSIYLVVRFLPATLNFGQTLLPITINAVAEKNKLDVCQRLLLEFAETYTVSTALNDELKQVYTSPSVVSNFNDVFDGFRSLLYMSGTLLISENSNPFTIIDSTTNKKIDCISSSFSTSVQIDSQVFFGNKNFSKSVGRAGTIVLNITSYITNDDFINKCLNVALGKTDIEPMGVNTPFVFTIKYKNGITIENVEFRLVDFSNQQNIGELPIGTITFAI